VREVPLQELQEDLVADVEQIRAQGRHAIADEGDRGVALATTHGREHHGADRIGRRIRREHLAVLLEDLDELAEVGRLPVPAGPLALLEDRVERLLSRGEIGHGHELRPVEVGARGLSARRPDEQVALAELVGEVRQAVLDRAIEVADRGEVLELGHDVALGHQGHGVVHRRVDALSALERHALRALEEQEVL
jgi:hypothetical protein